MNETVNPEVIIPKERDISSNASPGIRLKRAREAAKLSVQVIARQLYLSENVITTLEKDQYEKLPGLTFAKGYLRAYAKLLNISPDELIQAFNDLGLPEEPSAQFQVPLLKTQSNSLDRYIRWVTYGLAGVLILLFLMWWQSTRKPLPVSAEPQAVSSSSISNSTANSAINTSNNPAGSVTENISANTQQNVSSNVAGSQHVISSLALPSTSLPMVKQGSGNAILPNAVSPESISSTATPTSTSVNNTTTNSTTASANALPDSSSSALSSLTKSGSTVGSTINKVAKKADNSGDVSGLSGSSSEALMGNSETHFPPDNSTNVNKTGTNAANQSMAPRSNGRKKPSVVLSDPFE